MVTITRNNIINTLPLFVRDVLRENLTDPSIPVRTQTSWIFKGEPEDRNFNPPFVMIELENEESKRISLNASKFDLPRISISIRIWSRKMEERDSLCNQIRNILIDTSSDDGTISINDNNLLPNSSFIDVSAIKVDTFPKLIREGIVTIEYDYIGS